MKFHFGSIAIAVFALAVAAPASAAQRAFVATNGVDTNPCSLASPCRSFTAAIAAVDPGGEVIALDSGGYGAFTIAGKSVSVIAPQGIYAGISVFGGTDGIVIDAAGNTVALRGLVINGQGGNNGIVVTNANTVHIDDCTVSNMAVSGVVLDADASVYVTQTVVRSVGLNGLRMNNGKLTASRIEVRGTGNHAVYITNGTAFVADSIITRTSGRGIVVQADGGNVSQLTLERTSVTYAAFEGILAWGNGGTASLVAIDNVVSDIPAESGIVESNATVRASGNTVTRVGGWGLKDVGGGTFESAQDNFVQGNASGTTQGSITSVGKF
jgi:hypothetical protein